MIIVHGVISLKQWINKYLWVTGSVLFFKHEGNQSFIDMIKMGINGRNVVLDQWNFWSTRKLGRSGWSCVRRRHLRFVLTIMVGFLKSLLILILSLIAIECTNCNLVHCLVFPSIKVQEHVGNDKSCVWKAPDFADGELKDETFCIRFGSVESEFFCSFILFLIFIDYINFFSFFGFLCWTFLFAVSASYM